MILDKEPNFSLNKVTQLSGKKQHDILVKALTEFLCEQLFISYTGATDFSVDFCNKKFAEYYNASSFYLQFTDGEQLELDEGPPSFKDIVIAITKEGRLEDHDSTDFKHSVLYQTLITKDDNDNTLTSGKIIEHIHGEIKYLEQSYFLVDGEWYLIDSSFIEDLNKECSQLIKRVIDDKLISEKFNVNENESDFNLKFINQPNWLVFDTITPNNMELCDILKYDSSSIHLVHIKKGFDNSLRNLASQVIISAKLLRADIRDKFKHIESVEEKTKKGLKSSSSNKKKIGGQIFPTGGLKEIFKYKQEKNIIFCLAFVDTAKTDRSIKTHLSQFDSNIAKFMLLELNREIKAMEFDFKIIQLQKAY